MRRVGVLWSCTSSDQKPHERLPVRGGGMNKTDAVMEEGCAVECCERRHYARGYCKAHYYQLWSKGCVDERPIRSRHGYYKTPTHYSWRAMHARCSDESHKDYQRYGGRGVVVCDQWAKFESFLEDMGERPEGMTLGRIDNEKGYSPENCRWEGILQQQNNKTTNRTVLIDGKSKTVAEWSREHGISVTLAHGRIHAGWDPAEAVTREPVKRRQRDSSGRFVGRKPA